MFVILPACILPACILPAKAKLSQGTSPELPGVGTPAKLHLLCYPTTFMSSAICPMFLLCTHFAKNPGAGCGCVAVALARW